MNYIELLPEKGGMRIQIDKKSVCVKGHQDSDAFRIYTESFETHPSLTSQDRKVIKDFIQKRNDSGRYPLTIID